MENNNNAPLSKVKYPTDFDLVGVYLIAPSITSLDLKPYLVELSYFEDIFNNTISGKLVVSDAVGVLNFGSLNGNEYIKLIFRKEHDSEQTINRTFRIFSVTNRKIDESNDSENYTIQFCSDEFVLSEQYRISKSYKSTKISKIIYDVLVDVLKVKKYVDIEETTGVYDFVLPNKKLFETINWLSTYALPDSKNPGADMLFFENNNGYYFRSLQTLFKQKPVLHLVFNPKNINQKVIQYEKDKSTGGEGIFLNVMKIDFLDYFDTLGGTSKGTYNNRVICIDTITREKNNVDFNYKDYFNSSQHMNDWPIINNYKNRFNKANYEPPDNDKDTGTLRLAISNNNQLSFPFLNRKGQVGLDTLKKNIFVEKYLPNRVSQIALSNYMRLRVTVPGNTGIVAGVTVRFTMFGIVPIDQKGGREPDWFISGNYLVTAVRHIINNTTYISVVEMIKESVTYPYVDGSGTDSVWNSIVSGDPS